VAAAKFSNPCKEYIRGLVRYCRDITGHTEYEITLSFEEESSKNDGSSFWTPYAAINVNHVYLLADIEFYPLMAKDWNKKNHREMGQNVLHEICHLFLEPVTDLFMWDVPASQEKFARDTVERQTQRIRNAIMLNMPDQWYEPSKIKEYCESVR